MAADSTLGDSALIASILRMAVIINIAQGNGQNTGMSSTRVSILNHDLTSTSEALGSNDPSCKAPKPATPGVLTHNLLSANCNLFVLDYARARPRHYRRLPSHAQGPLQPQIPRVRRPQRPIRALARLTPLSRLASYRTALSHAEGDLDRDRRVADGNYQARTSRGGPRGGRSGASYPNGTTIARGSVVKDPAINGQSFILDFCCGALAQRISCRTPTLVATILIGCHENLKATIEESCYRWYHYQCGSSMTQ